MCIRDRGILGVMQWGKLKRKWKIKEPKHGIGRVVLDGLKILLTANYFFMGFIITNQDGVLESFRIIGQILFGWVL